MAAMAVVLAVGGCASEGGARVALLADVGTAPPATRPAVHLSSAETARAALEFAARMEKLHSDAAYIDKVATRMRGNLVAETVFLSEQKDAEIAARAASLLSFNAAVNRFLIEAEQQPDATKRDAWIAWGLSAAHVQQVAAVYDEDPDVRLEAALTLAHDPAPQNDALLAALVRDEEAEVAVRTMDAIWDRAPSQVLIDALWDRGISYAFKQLGISTEGNAGSPGPRVAANARVITVRGQAIAVGNNPYAEANNASVASLAVDLLVRLNDDRVRTKVNDLFVKLMPPRVEPGIFVRALSPTYGQPAESFSRLVAAYHPVQALPAMLAVLKAGGQDGYTNDVNGQQYRGSSRIDLMALALPMMSETPEDYGLVKLSMWGNRWMLAGTEEDEEKAVDKVLAFWKEHYRQFGASTPDLPVVPAGGTRTIYRVGFRE
jgi:hypothetical protein